MKKMLSIPLLLVSAVLYGGGEKAKVNINVTKDCVTTDPKNGNQTIVEVTCGADFNFNCEGMSGGLSVLSPGCTSTTKSANAVGDIISFNVPPKDADFTVVDLKSSAAFKFEFPTKGGFKGWKFMPTTGDKKSVWVYYVVRDESVNDMPLFKVYRAFTKLTPTSKKWSSVRWTEVLDMTSKEAGIEQFKADALSYISRINGMVDVQKDGTLILNTFEYKNPDTAIHIPPVGAIN